ncbi:MAG: DUF1553 domain-containing protein [Rubripirellula sp.]
MRSITLVIYFLAAIAWLSQPTMGDDGVGDEERRFFETKIRPVLVEHCYECHASESDEVGGNLLLDRPHAMKKGGESGAVIAPGNPDDSLLIQAIRFDDPELEMPPDGPLKESVVNDFVRWVQRGAKDPRPIEPQASGDPATAGLQELDSERHWSFFPRNRAAAPKLDDRDWPRDPIDAFVLSRMEDGGLSVADDADARTLIRRLYYDLIGLPPRLDDIEAFVESHGRDPRPALETLVDDLLGRTEFGERWGRHWLDVARYGESNGDDGLGRNATFPHAWRYRDYVIDAMNRDLPYDAFLKEQIAGDLLESKTPEERNRRLIATGFLAIGSKPAAAMNKNFAMDVVDDQINVVCTSVMGLSVACARCHDHKHDPIPTRDYYALAGIFSSTETLYGLSGNEKLTAPPTSLHQLRTDWDPSDENRSTANRKNVPSLDQNYVSTVQNLQPVLYERLMQKTDRLQLGKDFKASKKNYAVVENNKIHGELPTSTSDYTVSFWFKNNLKNDARPITAYLFSLAKIGDKTLPGDHLGIGGQHDKNRTGKIFLFNGNSKKQSLAGSTVIPTGTWNHVTVVREKNDIRVFLNGQKEIEGQLESSFGGNVQFCLARRSDQFAPLNGNIGEFAVFSCAISDDEALAIYDASGWPRAKPPAAYPLAMGVREKSKPVHSKIHINGDGAKKGPEVPRGYLSAYQLVSHRPVAIEETHAIDSKSSGRLELANWLTDPQHPQTARVIVNRVWMHLMGKAIVETPDDFGVYGARPTHPLLLDHLAERLIREEWSIKKLIRAIVLTRTYGLSSKTNNANVNQDPENRLFGRHEIRRLDAESLRDSILSATGTLDSSVGCGSAIDQIDQLINWPPGEATKLHRENNHRSIYLCFLRHDPPDELAAFDLPVGVAVTGIRDETTLPTQSLFMLNSRFVVNQSVLFATALCSRSEIDDVQRVRVAFEAILRRSPTETELSGALAHVERVQATLAKSIDRRDQRVVKAWASLCQGLISTNEFRYVD